MNTLYSELKEEEKQSNRDVVIEHMKDAISLFSSVEKLIEELK